MGFGLWIISGLASLLLSVGFLFFPGGRIATQFNVSGQPSDFMQVGNYAWFGILLTLVTNGVVIFVLKLLSRPDGLKWANMPHKDYWMATAERQNTAMRKLRDTLCWTGTFINGTFCAAHGLIYAFNFFPGTVDASVINIFVLAVLAISFSFVYFLIRNFKPKA